MAYCDFFIIGRRSPSAQRWIWLHHGFICRYSECQKQPPYCSGMILERTILVKNKDILAKLFHIRTLFNVTVYFYLKIKIVLHKKSHCTQKSTCRNCQFANMFCMFEFTFSIRTRLAICKTIYSLLPRVDFQNIFVFAVAVWNFQTYMQREVSISVFFIYLLFKFLIWNVMHVDTSMIGSFFSHKKKFKIPILVYVWMC